MSGMDAGTVVLGMACGSEWVDIGQKKRPDVSGASVDFGGVGSQNSSRLGLG